MTTAAAPKTTKTGDVLVGGIKVGRVVKREFLSAGSAWTEYHAIKNGKKVGSFSLRKDAIAAVVNVVDA